MNKQPFSITLTYFIFGIIWLVLGTLAISAIDKNYPNTDFRFLYQYKNTLFIFVTGVVLFFLLKRHETRLLKLENNYQNLFEASPGATYVMDKKTLRFMAVNEVMVAKYGYTKAQFMEMTTLDIRPEEEKKRMQEYLHSEHVEGLETGVWLHQKKNGETFYMLISHRSIVFQEKEAYIVIAIDVDQNIRNEQKLKEIRWQNSHEIRRPAVNIKGLVDLLKDNEPADPTIIELLHTSVNELEDIIHKINSNSL